MAVLSPDPALGFSSKLFLGDATPITTSNGSAFDFLSETFTHRQEMRNFQGMSGTRAHAAKRTRTVTEETTGDVVMNPKSGELAKILKYILGGTPSGTSYPLAETLPSFVAQIVKKDRLFTYSGCLCTTARFRGSYGNPLELTFGAMGKTEAEAAASGAPAIAPDITTAPFVFSDMVLTLAGDTIDDFDFDLAIDNRVVGRRVNSLTATALYSTDRVITVRMTIPYGDDTTKYGLDPAGVPVVAAWTFGGHVLTFSLPRVQVPKDAPPVASRDELRLSLSGTAGWDAAPGDELVCSLT
jgi:hypothetical protein